VLNGGRAAAPEVHVTVTLPEGRPELQFFTSSETRLSSPPTVSHNFLVRPLTRDGLVDDSWSVWTLAEDRRSARTRLRIVRQGEDALALPDTLLVATARLQPLVRGVELQWQITDSATLHEIGLVNVLAPATASEQQAALQARLRARLAAPPTVSAANNDEPHDGGHAAPSAPS